MLMFETLNAITKGISQARQSIMWVLSKFILLLLHCHFFPMLPRVVISLGNINKFLLLLTAGYVA